MQAKDYIVKVRQTKDLREKKERLGNVIWSRDEAAKRNDIKAVKAAEKIMEKVEKEIAEIESPRWYKAKQKVMEKMSQEMMTIHTEMRFAKERVDKAPGKLSQRRFRENLKVLEDQFSKLRDANERLSKEQYALNNKVKKIKPCDYDAICLDNTGLEDQFDLSVNYMVEATLYGIIEDDGFINVYDKFGELVQVDKTRFEIVKA